MTNIIFGFETTSSVLCCATEIARISIPRYIVDNRTPSVLSIRYQVDRIRYSLDPIYYYYLDLTSIFFIVELRWFALI